MPQEKDLKRLIRARMKKTGESYTAARSKTVGTNAPDPAQFPKLAGMTDAAVEKKTGRTWKGWVDELDRVGAVGMSHREIALHLQGSYEISGWWAQSVTIGYERIRGLRDVGQKRSGQYEANKSKTFPVPISKLYRAFRVEKQRRRWLEEDELEIRTATVDKSMRVTWPDGTSVHFYFTDKGPEKSQVAIQHVGLSRKADIAKRKEYWSDRLAELVKLLRD